MRTHAKRWLRGLLLVLGTLLIGGLGPALIIAQEESATPETIAPISRETAPRAQLRTPEEMAEAEALAPSAPGGEVKPFMPTVDLAEYAAAKASAAAIGGPPRPAGRTADPEPLATPPVTGAFEGQDSSNCSGCRPPDTHGAVGPSQYVQVVNTTVRVYSKAGATLKTTSLKSFFGTTESLFDPRVVYDPIWNRWVILATRKATSPTDTIRRYRIAASLSSDATGSFRVFSVAFSGNPGDWLDYPGLGFDQDAVIVTGNLFRCVAGTCGSGENSFVGGRVRAIAKARLYNGLSFSVPVFAVFSSPQPPLVLDQNAIAVISRVAGSPNVQLYRLSNGSNPGQTTLSSPFSVNVGSYSVPPVNAAQPGTTNRLDTLDGRFQNASTQNGSFLYEVHTTNFSTDAGARPTARIYKINWAANTLAFSDAVFEDSDSYDFNPSIAASGVDRALVVWSSTDPPVGTHAHIRASGKDIADATFPSTSGVFLTGGGSATFYNPSGDIVERWGDYSAVTVDPSNSKRFWVTNEKINSSTVWGSRIGHYTFP
jgi:hypothetical protein